MIQGDPKPCLPPPDLPPLSHSPRCLAGAAFPQTVLAPTPPMGWNSWDSFGTGVTEEEVKANADYMSSKLAKYGWQLHRGGHTVVGSES